MAGAKFYLLALKGSRVTTGAIFLDRCFTCGNVDNSSVDIRVLVGGVGRNGKEVDFW